MLLKPSLLTALPLPRHSCLHPSFPRRAWPREDGGGNQSPPSYPHMSFLVPRGISLPHAQRHPHCHPTIAKNPHPLLPSPHDQPLPLSSRMRGPFPLSHAPQMSFRVPRGISHPGTPHHPQPSFVSSTFLKRKTTPIHSNSGTKTNKPARIRLPNRINSRHESPETNNTNR